MDRFISHGIPNRNWPPSQPPPLPRLLKVLIFWKKSKVFIRNDLNPFQRRQTDRWFQSESLINFLHDSFKFWTVVVVSGVTVLSTPFCTTTCAFAQSESHWQVTQSSQESIVYDLTRPQVPVAVTWTGAGERNNFRWHQSSDGLWKEWMRRVIYGHHQHS